MAKNPTILVATTNIGKFTEITAEFKDLHLDFVDLHKMKLDKFDVEEDKNTTWENALKKAKFYAEKSGLLTLAEDTGLFIDALSGEPGVHTKRYADTAEARNEKVLSLLKGVPEKKRTAHFETSACLYDPATKSFYIFEGIVNGRIAQKVSKISRPGLGYDSIFYYPPFKKTFAELDLLKKNSVSHRGKVTNQVRYFFLKQFAIRQIFVPCAIIVRDRKMLLNLRRDLRPDFDRKWEFPGGGVEDGESIYECLKRETKEETGYTVEILEQLPDILSTAKGLNYQVHLMPFICKIKSGSFKTIDSEVHGHDWFSYNKAIKSNLLPLNKKSIQTKNNKIVLKKYID